MCVIHEMSVSTSNSVILEHSHNTKHLNFFGEAKILASNPFFSIKFFGEALKIEKNPNNYNFIHWWKLMIHLLSTSLNEGFFLNDHVSKLKISENIPMVLYLKVFEKGLSHPIYPPIK